MFGKNQRGRAFLLIDMALYIYAFYPSFDQTRKIISIISYIDKELNFKGDINTKKKLKNTLERYSFIFQSGNLPDLCDWLPLLVEYEIYLDNKYIITINGKKNLYKYCNENFSISHSIVEKIIDGTWMPKFKKHMKYENLIIIEKCID